jgi:hypothetical protein
MLGSMNFRSQEYFHAFERHFPTKCGLNRRGLLLYLRALQATCVVGVLVRLLRLPPRESMILWPRTRKASGQALVRG